MKSIDLMLAKVDRNFERVELFKWCIDFVNANSSDYRISWDEGLFFLEKKVKINFDVIWIRTIVSDIEK